MRYDTLVFHVHFILLGVRREYVWQMASRKKRPSVVCRAPHKFPRASAEQRGGSACKTRRVLVLHSGLEGLHVVNRSQNNRREVYWEAKGEARPIALHLPPLPGRNQAILGLFNGCSKHDETWNHITNRACSALSYLACHCSYLPH